MTVRRYDIGRIDGPKMTPQGYLKANGYATRAGVFLYRTPDGSVRRELRPPEEVFAQATMDSLAEVVLTNNHPPEPLTSRNTRHFGVGFVGEKPERKGAYASVRMTVTDADAIKAVVQEGKRELSCGYTCDVDHEKGIWNGEEYDAIQKNIRYNHLAIVDSGRAGPEARIRFDASDALQVDVEWTAEYVNNLPDSSFAYVEPGGEKDEEGKTVPRSLRHFPFKNAEGEVDLPHLRNALARAAQSPAGKKAMPKLTAAAKAAGIGEFADGGKKKGDGAQPPAVSSGKQPHEETKMAKIKIDAVEYEISDAVAPVVMAKLDALEAVRKELEASKKEGEALRGRADGLDAELKKKGEELVAASKKADLSDADLLKRAEGILAVRKFARDVLGESAKIDEMDVAAMRKAVVESKGIKTDGKAAEYIDAAFDVLMAGSGNKDLAGAISGTLTADAAAPDSTKARADSMKRSQELWKTYKGPGVAA